MQRIAVLVLVSVGACTSANAAAPPGPFLCIVDQATGFAFDKKTKTWHQARFNAGERLILRRAKNNSLEGPAKELFGASAAWIVLTFGKDGFPTAVCGREVNEYGMLFCRGLLETFTFNATTLRFQHTYDGGYLRGDYSLTDPNETADTPSLSIGTCSAL